MNLVFFWCFYIFFHFLGGFSKIFALLVFSSSELKPKELFLPESVSKDSWFSSQPFVNMFKYEVT